MKSQSIAYLVSGSEHIYWIVGLEGEVHCAFTMGFVDNNTFKNVRATFFQSRVGQAKKYQVFLRFIFGGCMRIVG